ncbi:MAG: M23 family metallopeptidase, partial [Candidatus Doudnabacteria bacterium]|nr:M23 family metallopeptidase [Candidatus Doudnabacteria bacterium]
TDYIARFSMELVFLVIAGITLSVNISLARHANLLETKDQSVIFSYLRTNPDINLPLLKSFDTTRIVVSDNLVADSADKSPFAQTLLVSSSQAAKQTLVETTTIQENVIVKTNPTDSKNYQNLSRTEYTVVSGDTISRIASSYDISPQTIMKENQLDEFSIIKPGQTLTILPFSGVSHTVGEKDTIASIAAKYKVDEFDLMDANDLELPNQILVGDVLTIPLNQVDVPSQRPPSSVFVRDESNKVALTQAQAPGNLNPGDLSFLWPTSTRGVTQGYSSRHRALDISNSQMVPIYASEAGFVEVAGWSPNGYGNMIIINHGNGFKTLYAHANQLYVKAGDRVNRGQTIAQQGRTGRVRGATGIHLHFEILKNGIQVKPFNYVSP